MFRFHVGGDIIDNIYFDYMVAIARDFPETKFLAFTKKYEIVNAYIDRVVSDVTTPLVEDAVDGASSAITDYIPDVD